MRGLTGSVATPHFLFRVSGSLKLLGRKNPIRQKGEGKVGDVCALDQRQRFRGHLCSQGRKR